MTQRRTLTGDHCQCPTCREYFNSTFAFDKHRTGKYVPNERRCLTVAEMRAKGMALSRNGFWVSQVYVPGTHPTRGELSSSGDRPSPLIPVGGQGENPGGIPETNGQQGG